MRVDVRLIFSSSFCDKMFQDAGRLFFSRDAALRNAAYLSSTLGLTKFAVALTLGVYVDCRRATSFPVLTFFGVSHFSHFFRSSAQPLTLPSRWYAATCTYYAGAFFLVLSLSLAYGKGLRHVSQYLVCSFVLGILVQIIHSATPFLFTCLRCILHVRLCCSAFVLRARLCAL
jgi:hypothetical protein